ncbi:alpha/beta hydrolase [Streptococcus sp. NLN76]|uniref:alpha/beta hydrolase n=1 Tax=Streptococcus sp. NLN76 TaxID=2822800 RepID=UPI0018AAFDE7|nr:alpha/beta hydrolase [Streptococcus sp. NLN76]MBF8970006.1 alpha/beta hydrolase [Streptococcus sp. NLN76]
MKITKDTSIQDLITNPIFEDYGHLLFPVDRFFDPQETIGDITDSQHFIWYSNLQVESSLAVLNYFAEEREKGQRIFYPIYTLDEIAKDPSRADTGLFYFKGQPQAEFAIVNAGGGFHYVAALHDSFPQALEISQAGYHAFALIYRPHLAYQDLGRTLEVIQGLAKDLDLKPTDYSLWGGSAGARMAITLGNRQSLTRYSRNLEPAAAVISQYTGYSNVSPADAPTYSNCGTNDGIANWRVMEERSKRLKRLGIPSEFHVYPALRHGFGIGLHTKARGWTKDAIHFWENQMKQG